MALSPPAGLHDDILLSIFSFLPIPDLARCAAVCEQWHRIVTGFRHLWKGKRYVSHQSPKESDETRAVMSTLLPLREVVVEWHVEFMVKIFYPRVVLLVTDISGLGIVRECPRLRCTHLSTEPDIAVTGLRHVPSGIRSLCLLGTAVTAKDLLEALPCLPLLEELELGYMPLAHLRFLCRCPQLRRLCLQFSTWSNDSELSNVRHLVRLETLDLTGCTFDADVLCAVLPSLSRLGTLLLAYALRVDHLRFLRHCPQLHTLSLFATCPPEAEAFRELYHLSNLQLLGISKLMYRYLRKVLRLRLPQVKIYYS